MIPQVVACGAELGPFGSTGPILECLATNGIGVFSKGTDVVKCLQKAIGNTCITQLPQPCLNLSGKSGLELGVEVAACTIALGPFAIDDAVSCLTKGLLEGDDIIGCLLKSLGWSTSTSGGGSCPAPTSTSGSGKACVTALPDACLTLDDLSLGKLASRVDMCSSALGAYAAGAVKECLNIQEIINSVLPGGTGAVECLLDSLRSVCINVLPAACSNLVNVSNGQLTTQLPQCIAALGPFTAGGVSNCLANPVSGQILVTCMTNILFPS